MEQLAVEAQAGNDGAKADQWTSWLMRPRGLPRTGWGGVGGKRPGGRSYVTYRRVPAEDPSEATPPARRRRFRARSRISGIRGRGGLRNIYMALTASPARETTRLDRLLETITGGESILGAIRAMTELADTARRVDSRDAVEALLPVAEAHSDDPLASYLALYALAGISSPDVDRLLLGLLATGDAVLSQHAAWALSRHRPVPAAVPHLARMVEEDGFSKMMAELAIENWLRKSPELIRRIDPDQVRPSLEGNALSVPALTVGQGGGLRVAQVLMQGRVDADLTAAGTGDGGGLVTLQVGLTRELAKHQDVEDVYLITRLIDDDSGRFSDRQQSLGEGTLARIEFGEPGYVASADMWGHRAELELELRRFLVDHGPFDALHLRFADVGTFVAARLGEELGIPVFFTLAPDPHGVIASAEKSGELTRRGFAAADETQHYLFRAWLVEWMLERAERLALLPRPHRHELFRDLMAVDVSTPRFSVIPEGIDYGRADKARQEIAALHSEETVHRVILDLNKAVDAMPTERHGLPTILSVGRLHPVKGMSRVVAAWAGDPHIRSSYNLIIVGGNLEEPSRDERLTLAEITDVAEGASSEGLVILGGRSHEEVALIMAAADAGTPGAVGARGIYVSASAKEEFGLAIVEALAAGLPVVAPRNGGPATYVEDGFTGYLADTMDIDSIREGMRWADRARHSRLRAEAARKKIRTKYSLEAMANGLVELYRPSRPHSKGSRAASSSSATTMSGATPLSSSWARLRAH